MRSGCNGRVLMRQGGITVQLVSPIARVGFGLCMPSRASWYLVALRLKATWYRVWTGLWSSASFASTCIHTVGPKILLLSPLQWFFLLLGREGSFSYSLTRASLFSTLRRSQPCVICENCMYRRANQARRPRPPSSSGSALLASAGACVCPTRQAHRCVATSPGGSGLGRCRVLRERLLKGRPLRERRRRRAARRRLSGCSSP